MIANTYCTDVLQYWARPYGRCACAGTHRAMAHLQADMLGLDFMETTDGTYLVLESNDTPGLAGFPDEVRSAVAQLVRRKLET